METYDLQQVDHFDDLNLKSDLLRGIYSYGYERPSEIQRKAILPILQGFDIIVQAPSGTGKSTAFIISVLQLIDEDLQECQAIILTLDLTQQLSHLTQCLAKFLKISIYACDKSTSLEDLEGKQILIGTPEIILKMLNLGSLKMNTLKIIVVDEADKLFSQEEAKGIFEHINENIQIAKKCTRKPVMIEVKKEELVLERFRHFYILVDENESKNEILVELLEEGIGTTQVLIYCNRNETVNEVVEVLSKNSSTCSKIDETMEFSDREAAMKSFRTGESRFLVTTGLFSTGVEIQQISIMLNYDLPLTKEGYSHRVGRCHRFKKGSVINFIKSKETQELKELEKYYGIIFDCYTDYFF